MGRKVLYLAVLAVAATAVFLTTYFFGRNSSLEAELERMTAPGAVPGAGKSRGIPSLERVDTRTEARPEIQEPTGEPLGEGIHAVRSPLESPGLVIVADLPALQPPQQGVAGALTGGIEAFLEKPPADVQIGLRPLAGAEAWCDVVEEIRRPGRGPEFGELAAAIAAASRRPPTPRNPAGAVAAAAADLEAISGERTIVVLAGGEEGCNADLCGAAGPPGGTAQRVHVILIASPPRVGAEAGMPEAGTDRSSQPVFEPPWEAPYRCLAERSGGTMSAVSTAAALEKALRRIASELESAIVVKAFHYTGQEVKGISPGGESGWGATLRLGGYTPVGAGVLESPLFPTAFAVPAGVYVVKAFYAGQARTAAVAVAPGERAEVRVMFATGELFVQANDAAGNEIVGDSTGFRCAWGVDVLAGEAGEAGEAGDARSVASTCTFPARLELPPGTYRVRARWKGIERVIDEVTVEARANTVHAVAFGGEEP